MQTLEFLIQTDSTKSSIQGSTALSFSAALQAIQEKEHILYHASVSALHQVFFNPVCPELTAKMLVFELMSSIV